MDTNDIIDPIIQKRGGIDMSLDRLATEVQSILKENGWSFRMAQSKTGVSFSAIERMTKGVSVETDTIIRFAQAISKDGEKLNTVIQYLNLSGKSEIVNLLKLSKMEGISEYISLSGTKNNLPDKEYIDLYQDANQEDRELVKLILKRINSQKSRIQ